MAQAVARLVLATVPPEQSGQLVTQVDLSGPGRQKGEQRLRLTGRKGQGLAGESAGFTTTEEGQREAGPVRLFPRIFHAPAHGSITPSTVQRWDDEDDPPRSPGRPDAVRPGARADAGDQHQ